MKNFKQTKGFTRRGGFTLVELIISVGITAVLMVGIATFFSSTFRNMFNAREKATNSQGQFVVNTILDGKFVNAQKVQQMGAGGTFAVIKNDMDKGDLPFTYIGRDGMTPPIAPNGHVVFKDFFVFNGIDGYGSLKSKDTGIKNPAGVASGLTNSVYITAPLENKIYVCLFPASPCVSPSALNIAGLNQPMDIDSDGNNTLYVADAGNDRVIAINRTTLAVTDLAKGLNYPTGLAYYSPKLGEEYLFVADTYNHQIKRIDLSDKSIETVVGAGNDEDCNTTSVAHEHTALFCKLRFPTDVVVADDHTYYIADTGNGRVLKVSDPDPDLKDRELLATVKGAAIGISKIDFKFPDNTISITPDPIQEGVTPNDIHKGWYDNDGKIVRFNLTAPIVADFTESITTCTPHVPQPPPPAPPIPDDCITHTYFRGFDVDPDQNLFEVGDSILVGSDFYSVSSSSGGRVLVSPDSNEVSYGPPTVVRLDQTISGEKKFHLNLDTVEFPPGFNVILSKIYDAAGAYNNDPPNRTILRIGDGVLGTKEDTISVYEDGDEFPTGLSQPASGAPLIVSGSPEYNADDFSDFDYVSNFVVEGFDFNSLNDDKILELYFKAKLGEDAEGNPLWQEYTLDSDAPIP